MGTNLLFVCATVVLVIGLGWTFLSSNSVIRFTVDYERKFPAVWPEISLNCESQANPGRVNRSSFGTFMPQFGRCTANDTMHRRTQSRRLLLTSVLPTIKPN